MKKVDQKVEVLIIILSDYLKIPRLLPNTRVRYIIYIYTSIIYMGNMNVQKISEFKKFRTCKNFQKSPRKLHM